MNFYKTRLVLILICGHLLHRSYGALYLVGINISLTRICVAEFGSSFAYKIKCVYFMMIICSSFESSSYFIPAKIYFLSKHSKNKSPT